MEAYNIDTIDPLQNYDDQQDLLKPDSRKRSSKMMKYIKGTIIKKEDIEKVDKKDYSFYAAPNDNEFDKILKQFHPDGNDKFLFLNTDDQLRLIFGNTEKYSEKEETQYQIFIKYCIWRDNNIYKHYDKSDLMRILDACHFDIEDTLEELNLDHKWRVNTLPIFLTEPMKNLLQSGVYYIHGRDRSLRPITVFSPAAVLDMEFEIKDAIFACHFVDQYIIDFMLAPEKVENWVGILDLGNLSFSSLPKQWILEFIKAFSHHYYARIRRTYLLNSSFGVRWMWNIVKIFVDNVSKSKIVVEGSNTHQSLQEGVHPKQLQNKFGGEAENITIFWPPYSPSNEYGVDPSKLNTYAISSDVKSRLSDKITEFSPDAPINENMKSTNTTNPFKSINGKSKQSSLNYCTNNNKDLDLPEQINLRPSNNILKEDHNNACWWSIF